MINKFTFKLDGTSLSIPPIASGNSITGTIDWGDGTTSDYINGLNSHTYDSSGTYTVTFATTDFETTMGGALAGYSTLISCELDDNLLYINGGTFYNCTNLKEVTIPYMAIVRGGAFGNSGLETVNFGSKDKNSIVALESNEASAFSGCSNLAQINYYTIDDTLVGTTNSTYFIIDSSTGTYATVYFLDSSSEEIRNIRIGSHMPGFKHINMNRDSKVVWKMALGSRVIWDLHQSKTFVEYLKISNTYNGAKFLEHDYFQTIFTDVYWVHKVDGEIVETQLYTNELDSWECETLEAYNVTSNGKTYVNYYKTPIHDGFGQHDMTITYTSPDTGNLLSIEYPVYYLKEVELLLYKTSYDWYPFRGVWAENSTEGLPSCYFKYMCTTKEGKEITDFGGTTYLYYYNTCYTFPTVKNAMYKLGENQSVSCSHVSDNYNNYNFTINVNVRKYTDSRNTNKNGNGTYYHKNIIPYSFTINYASHIAKYNSTNERHLYYFPNYDDDSIDIRVTQNITVSEDNFNTTNYSDCYDTFATTYKNTLCKNGSDSAFSNFDSKEDFSEYLKNCTFNNEPVLEDIVLDGVNISSLEPATNTKCSTFAYPYNTTTAVQVPNISTFGYIFWGDGTFDRHTFANKILIDSNATNYGQYEYDADNVESVDFEKYGSYTYGISNSKKTFTCNVTDNNVKLRAGSTLLDDGTVVPNYEDEYMFANSKQHTYADDGIYQVEITTPSGMNVGDISNSNGLTVRRNFWRFNINDSGTYCKSYSFLNSSDYSYIDGATENYLTKDNLLLCDYPLCYTTDENKNYIYARYIATDLTVGTSLGYRRCYGYNGASLNSGYETLTAMQGFRLEGLPLLTNLNINSAMINTYTTGSPLMVGFAFTSDWKYLHRLQNVSIDCAYSKFTLSSIPSYINYCNGGLTQYYGNGSKISSDNYYGTRSDMITSYSSGNNSSCTIYNNGAITLTLNDGCTDLQSIYDLSGGLPDDPSKLAVWTTTETTETT